MIVNYGEESIEQLKVQISDLESEVSTLRVQLKNKENGWNKEKAILQQKNELQDMQIKESKAREDNFRKMNETFMETLQGLSSDSSKFTNKSLKDLKGMFEGMNQDSEQSKIKKQDLITKLEAENRELKDQLHEKQLEVQREAHESEKNILTLQNEIKDLTIQNQTLQATIKKIEEDKKYSKDMIDYEYQLKITEMQSQLDRLKQENQQEIQNNNLLNEQRILQIKEFYEKERNVFESKLIKTKETQDCQSENTQNYIEELQISHQTELQQLQLQIQNMRAQQLQEQQQIKKDKEDYEAKLQDMQEKFKTFKTKSKTNDQNIKIMKEKIEKSKQDTEQITQLTEQNKKLKSKNKQLMEQVKKLEQAEIKLKDQLIEKNHIIEEEKMVNNRKENLIRNMQEQAVSIIHHDQSNFITENDLSISQFQLRQQANLMSANALTNNNSNLNVIHQSVQNMDGFGNLQNHQVSQGGLSSHQQSYNQHFKSVSESDFQQMIQNGQQGQSVSETHIQQDPNARGVTEEIPKRSAPNRAQQRLQGGNNPLAGQIVQRGQSKNMNSPEAKPQQHHMLHFQQHNQQLQQQQLQQQQQIQPPLYKQNSNNNLFQQNTGMIMNQNNGLYKSISSSNSNLIGLNNQTNRTNQSGMILTTNQDVMMYTQNTQNNYTDEDIVNIQNQNSIMGNYEKPLQGMIPNQIMAHSSSTNSMLPNQNNYQNNIFQNNNNPTAVSNSQISMPQTVQSRNLCEGCRIGAKHLFSQQRQNLSVPSRQGNSTAFQMQQQISQHQQSMEDDQQQFELQDLRIQIDDLTRQLEEKNFENGQLKQQIIILENQLETITQNHNEVLQQTQSYGQEIEKLNEILSSTNAEKRKKEENEAALKEEIKYLLDKLLKAKEKIDQQQQQQQDFTQKNSDSSSQNLFTDYGNNQLQYVSNSNSNNRNLIQQNSAFLNNNNQASSPKIKMNATNQNNSSMVFSEAHSNIRSNTIGNKFNLDQSLPQKYTSINVSNYNSTQNQLNNTDMTPTTHASNSNKIQNSQIIKNAQLTSSVNMSQMLNQSNCINQSLCLNGSTKSPGFLNFIHQNKENSSFQTRKNGFAEEKNLFSGYEKSPTSNFNLGKSTDLMQHDFSKQKAMTNTSQNLNIQSSSFVSNNFTSNNALEYESNNNKSYNSNLPSSFYQNNQSSYRQNSQASQYNTNKIGQSQGNQNLNICRSERKGQNNLKSMIQKEEERGFNLRSKTPFTSRFNQSLEKNSNIPMQDTSSPFEQTKKQLFPSDNNTANQLKNPLKTLQQQQMRRIDIPKSTKPSYLFD